MWPAYEQSAAIYRVEHFRTHLAGFQLLLRTDPRWPCAAKMLGPDGAGRSARSWQYGERLLRFPRQAAMVINRGLKQRLWRHRKRNVNKHHGALSAEFGGGRECYPAKSDRERPMVWLRAAASVFGVSVIRRRERRSAFVPERPPVQVCPPTNILITFSGLSAFWANWWRRRKAAHQKQLTWL